MKIALIYHNDADGIVSALVVKAAIQSQHFQEADIKFVPFSYYSKPDPKDFDDCERVYAVDCSFGPEGLLYLKEKHGKGFVWIDHHKSAIIAASSTGQTFTGLQSVDYAACKLCWQYFYGVTKQAPLLVEAINKFDNWIQDEEWESFTYPLNLCVTTLFKDIDSVNIELLTADDTIKQLVDSIGVHLFKYQQDLREAESIFVEQRTLLFNKKHFPVLLINSTLPGDSTIELVERKENFSSPVHLRYNIIGNKVDASVYTNDDVEGFDCSELAKQFGGGGHKKAAGFRCEKEEFDKLFL